MTETGPSKPGHYLFDLEGRLCHAAVSSDPLQSTDHTVAEEQTDFDLSASLASPSLPPALRVLLQAVAQGQEVLPGSVYLADDLVATAYPVTWQQAKLVAVVVSPAAVSQPHYHPALAVLNISRSIHAGHTMTAIFETVAREAGKLLSFDRLSITLFRPDTNEVEIYALHDDGTSSVQAGRVVPGDNTVTAWVVRHGQPIVTPDIRQEMRFVTYQDWTAQGYRSTLCHPLTLEGNVIGTLNFTSRTVNAYGDDTIRLVTPLAEQVAIAISNAQMRQRLLQESRRLRRIVEVANQVKHHLGLEGYLSVSEILRWMCEVACDLGWERALFCLRDPAAASTNDSFIAAFAGAFTEGQHIELDVLKAQRTRVGGFSTTPGARLSGVHRRIGDHSFLLGRHTESPLRMWHSGPIIVVPLALEGKLFGTFSVDRPGAPPSKEEVETLELLTDYATVVLHNSRLIAQLREQLAETERLREQEREYHLQMRQTERLRALGELASGVAHNFNNALTIIQGRIGLLRARSNDETTLRSLDIMHKVTQDAANIVRRIQNFARVREGDSDFERLDLSQLVQETVEATQPRWTNRSGKSSIHVTCQAPLPVPILGNSTELREVITNLLFNALDALPTGGEIIINVYQQEDMAKLVVRDTGTGMSEEVKKRIFDPFYTTKGGQGTGLGLSVSHNIVSRHKGRIEVESEPGRGTAFFLTFPLAPVSLSQTLMTAPPLPALPAQRLRILVVDDEPPVAETIGELIRFLGHEAQIENDPRRALQRLRLEVFDALFTDLGMPDMNGWQLIAEVRALNLNLPITLVTGWADRIAPGELQAQRVRLIGKPVDVGIIERTLGEIVSELRTTLH
ncbi:GAF domain-containing protein [Chloracidobacterium sp. MS 40/45]|uniref:ATP-binding protein n=1 Tax=Chloracidobacterium aggregatum TaxID=2851959 RepID=UPI001B8B4667|nr:ATP-binding protein [Chloracidobacterium aggregatum]QUV98927.1 GAF domain-containing protein [Chloracidobacterium sp. MS 40/45]